MKTFLAAIFILTISAINAFSQGEKTYLRTIAGNWEGSLEYLDYQENKRVKLKTYLFIKPASDGNSAEVTTVYDDFGRIIKEVETVKIDRAAKTYFEGDYEYKIESDEPGKIVLSASGQDGEKIEPFRKTIIYDENALTFLKETRTPFQFRNQLTLKRTTKNVLAKRTRTTQRREDSDVLKKALTANHPGTYRYQTPESLTVIFAETAAKIKNPLSEGESFTLVSQITNRIYCGHTFSNPYNANGLRRMKTIFADKLSRTAGN